LTDETLSFNGGLNFEGSEKADLSFNRDEGTNSRILSDSDSNTKFADTGSRLQVSTSRNDILNYSGRAIFIDDVGQEPTKMEKKSRRGSGTIIGINHSKSVTFF
jgi:hypothetical protein